MSEPTLFEAMTEFHNIAQAVAFHANEIALFHALSHTWNVARRPAVIEQWAEITARNAGLTKDTLPAARNKLVQTGVLFFDKAGNRSVPRYSLNALFGLPSPFDTRELQRDLRRNTRSNTRVSDGVNGVSYQVEGKEKGEQRRAPAREEAPSDALSMFMDSLPTEAAKDFDSLFGTMNRLHPSWAKHPHPTYTERTTAIANSKALFAITEEAWTKLAEFYAAIITADFQATYGKFWRPDNRGKFLESITDVLTSCDRWEAALKDERRKSR